MSFEPLKSKLIDKIGHVPDEVQELVTYAFGKAAEIADADIDELILGASRVTKYIMDGRAEEPRAFAIFVLKRIAHKSRRRFVEAPEFVPFSEHEIEALCEEASSSSAIQADIEIKKLLSNLDNRDRTIVMMRSRGFTYKQIGHRLGIAEASARCRYHLAKNRLRKLATGKRED